MFQCCCCADTEPEYTAKAILWHEHEPCPGDKNDELPQFEQAPYDASELVEPVGAIALPRGVLEEPKTVGSQAELSEPPSLPLLLEYEISLTTTGDRQGEDDVRSLTSGPLDVTAAVLSGRWLSFTLPTRLLTSQAPEIIVKPAGLCIISAVATRGLKKQPLLCGDMLSQVNETCAKGSVSSSVAMLDELKFLLKSQRREAKLRVHRISRFKVTVQLPGNLGLSVREADLTVLSVKPGLLADFNTSCDGPVLVLPGDRLVEANAAGADTDAILKAIYLAYQSEGRLDLIFVRLPVAAIT